MLFRQLSLLIIGLLGILVPIADFTGVLDSIDLFEGGLPSLTLFTVGAIAFYLSFERSSISGDVSELKQLLGRDVSELKQLINAVGHGGEGFRKVPVAEISNVAARMMRDVSTLRTLGTARQDLLDTDESAKLYLRETENRVAHGRPPFHYYRITSDQLRDLFIGHMVVMLSTKPDARHDIRIQLIPDIESTVTYQIFDDTHVLILLDTPHSPERKDYAVALTSSDPEIVNGFISHFDHAWATHKTYISDPRIFKRSVNRIF
jgi:hypothetical protein